MNLAASIKNNKFSFCNKSSPLPIPTKKKTSLPASNTVYMNKKLI